jgi:hypothetical protein
MPMHPQHVRPIRLQCQDAEAFLRNEPARQLSARSIKIMRAMRSFADKNELRCPSKLDQAVEIGGGGYAMRSLRGDFCLLFERESAHGFEPPTMSHIFTMKFSIGLNFFGFLPRPAAFEIHITQ